MARMLVTGWSPNRSRVGNQPEGIVQIRLATGRLDRMTWIACLLLSIFSLFGGRYPQLSVVQWAPWLIGIVFLSLPHGGLDDAVPSILRAGGLRRRAGPGFYLGYLGILVGTLAIWAVRADLGLISFLLFSCYHFGQGDLYWDHQRRVEAGLTVETGVAARAALLLARGSVAVFLPFVLHDQQFQEIGERLSTESGQVLMLPHWVGQYRDELLVVIAVVVLMQAASSLHEVFDGRATGDQQRVVLTGLLETVILLTLFVTVPPILSVGGYILCWHAPRHIWRLILLDPELRERVVGGRSAEAIVGFHRRSAGIVLAAVAVLALISAGCIRYDFAAERLVFPAFLFVHAITVPHVLTVVMLDRFQSVWRGGQ